VPILGIMIKCIISHMYIIKVNDSYIFYQ
jgi:hypothetical protein